jgi:hypothetical protein
MVLVALIAFGVVLVSIPGGSVVYRGHRAILIRPW